MNPVSELVVPVDQGSGCPRIDPEQEPLLRALIRENIKIAINSGRLNPYEEKGVLFVCDSAHWVKEHHRAHYVPYPPIGAESPESAYVCGLLTAELREIRPRGFRISHIVPNMGRDLATSNRQFGWDVHVRWLPPEQTPISAKEQSDVIREMFLHGIQPLAVPGSDAFSGHGSQIFCNSHCSAQFIRNSDSYTINIPRRGEPEIPVEDAREIVERLGSANLELTLSTAKSGEAFPTITGFCVRSLESLDEVLTLLRRTFGAAETPAPYPMRTVNVRPISQED